MNDDDFAELFKSLNSGPSKQTTWRDVGNEFEALGKTLGDVLRGAWERTDSTAGVGKLRDALETLVQGMGEAAEGTPEARQARDQLQHLRDLIREAAERASDELRPELLAILRQANAELRRFTATDE